MRIAIRHRDVHITSDGRVGGHDAGATLVRRLLRVFPDSVIVGPGPRRGDGFDVVPLEFLDGTDTVVVNMDVLDSVGVWLTLRESCEEPRLMNFMWWNSSKAAHPVERAALGLSCAMFPTFANSERTATEIREIVSSQVVQPIAAKARISWVNLGIRLDHLQERRATPVPVVLYPAIYLSDRKQPQVFLDVVERVARRTPVKVEARLHESHLVSERAMRLSQHDWVWVGPLTASRDSYWSALARTTAFLATAREESYGLQYVEAMVAGAVGVFPDLPWARAILPPDYPFLYWDETQAEKMLHRAVTEPDACREILDLCVGGSFAEWLREHHDDDLFDQKIAAAVTDWFGA